MENNIEKYIEEYPFLNYIKEDKSHYVHAKDAGFIDPDDDVLIGDSGGFLLNINKDDKFVDTHLFTEMADFYRKNKVYTFFKEDSIPHTVEIAVNAPQHFFFNENGKGFRMYPSNDVDEFKWSVSNDTLNILDGDTLVPYRIENVKTRGLHRSIFLRLLSEGTRNFHESFFPFISVISLIIRFKIYFMIILIFIFPGLNLFYSFIEFFLS